MTSKHWPRLALALVFALHVAAVLRFEPPAVVFGPDPIAIVDYETHYEQTLRAVEAFRHSGHTWAYDPHLLAGQVSGAVFDADNKLHELFTIALDRLGVPPARGFNLFILLAHLLVVPVVYAAARLFRLAPGAATGAAALASLVWLFDSFSHWAFWVGMISWGFASYLVLLPVALFDRWLGARGPAWLVATTLLLALVHHLHPFSFFALALPMGVLYARAFRTLSRAGHAAVVAMALAALGANLWWLSTAARFWHYVLDSKFYLDATLGYAVTDWLGLLREPSTTGVMAVRSSFRFLALGAALFGLLLWRREKDDRFLPFAATVGALAAAAYVGGHVTPMRHVQPYRFVLPATYFATIPAAAFGAHVVRSLRAAPPTRTVAAALALAAFVALPRFVRDALYFLPPLVPRYTRPLPAPPPNVNGPVSFGALVWPEPFDFRHAPLDPASRAIEAFVKEHDDGSGRWLVEWWMLGERLAWATDAQVIGGFRELNMAHSDANLFRRFPDGAPPDPDELRRYLERYAVKWVVVSNPMPALESRSDVLSLAATVLGTRIYRTKLDTSLLAGGVPGRVRATLNRIDVEGTPGGSMVLRYHYMEGLVCEPGCRVEREPVPGDRVGFLRVEGAPPNFSIVNGY